MTKFVSFLFGLCLLLAQEIQANENTVSAKVLRINGPISTQTLSKVTLDLIAFRNQDPFPAGLIVLLDSEGGDGDAAMAIGRLLRWHNAHVFVSNRCDSACVLIFMAGVVRAANPNTLGVHAGRLTLMTPEGKVVREVDASQSLDDSFQLATFNRDVRIYLQEMGIRHGILDVILAHRSMQVYKLSAADMSEYRVTGFDNTYLQERMGTLQRLFTAHQINRMSLFSRTMSVPKLCQKDISSDTAFVNCYGRVLSGVQSL